MPELPEVETVRRDLEAHFQKYPVIESIVCKRPNLRFPMPVARLKRFSKALVSGVLRRAKYLLIQTDQGVLLSHLGMTGSWQLQPEKTYKPQTHDHILLRLKGGQILVYTDPRRFGVFDAVKGDWQKHPLLVNLGLEPLFQDRVAAEKALWQRIKNRQVAIKTALMNQGIIVGVGNIYASEILFRAGVLPKRLCKKLSADEFSKILDQTEKVLKSAIQLGGSTISDYRHQGGEGGFQNQHQVYDRKGQACVVCGTPIRAAVLTGRSTFWCPKCQK